MLSFLLLSVSLCDAAAPENPNEIVLKINFPDVQHPIPVSRAIAAEYALLATAQKWNNKGYYKPTEKTDPRLVSVPLGTPSLFAILNKIIPCTSAEHIEQLLTEHTLSPIELVQLSLLADYLDLKEKIIKNYQTINRQKILFNFTVNTLLKQAQLNQETTKEYDKKLMDIMNNHSVFFEHALAPFFAATLPVPSRTLANDIGNDILVSFSPDGTHFASGGSCYNNTITIWDAANGDLLHTLEGHTERVQSVAFSPDGTCLASGSDDRTIKIWNITTGTLLHTLRGHTASITSVAFSPDGQMLVSGSANGIITIWDATTATILRTLQKQHADYSIVSVAFSPDGTRLASKSGNDGAIKIWDPANGTYLRTLQAYTPVSFSSVAFSPDGQLLASGSWDGIIKIWDAATGNLVRTLQRHTAFINSVAFSPDSQLLASESWDGIIKIWNLTNDTLLHTIKGHLEPIIAVAFSPDGTHLVSGSYDRTIKIWDLNPPIIQNNTTPYQLYLISCLNMIVTNEHKRTFIKHHAEIFSTMNQQIRDELRQMRITNAKTPLPPQRSKQEAMLEQLNSVD